jgi:ABC-type transport system involved in multi-copper enzyme maturation permease subunit
LAKSISVRGALLDRLHVATLLAEREVQTLVRGVGGYVALTVALVAVAWLVGTDLERARSSGLLVRDNPFQGPLLAAVLVLSMFLSISAVVSVARERERGTLEVLFYGPVDEPGYLFGKFAGQVLAYLLALPLLLLCFLLIGFTTGFLIPRALFFGLVASVVPVAEVVAFGLLLSVLAGRLRTSILLFIGVTVLFLAISVGYSVVSTIPLENPASPILPLRDSLAALDTVVDWLSPFAYLERVLENIALGAWPTVLTSLLAGLGHVAITLALASLLLRRRGVRHRGE